MWSGIQLYVILSVGEPFAIQACSRFVSSITNFSFFAQKSDKTFVL